MVKNLHCVRIPELLKMHIIQLVPFVWSINKTK